MEKYVYLLCAVTSIGCAVMLLRNYFRARARLLLWGSLFFVFFALSNIVLFIDLGILPPEIDLSNYRDSLTLIAVTIFVFGLIAEGDRA
ncbi:MAG TPA: DUF5985 family protein [Candidatus Angelobacter sp.]|nr:DUF5985 family protein [Candidatus Angelobacter sp.]